MSSRVMLAVLVLGSLVAEGRAAPPATPSEPPASPKDPSGTPTKPVSSSNFGASLGLAIVGGAAGFAGGVIGGYTVLGCSDEGARCTYGGDNAELVAGILFAGLGAAAGAHLGGYRADSRGHFGYTLLAAGIPATLGAITAALTDNSEDAGLALGFVLTTPLVAALTDHAYRVARHHDGVTEPPGGGGLIDVEIPLSTDLGIAVGYCRGAANPTMLCGRVGYRRAEPHFVDYPENRDALHASLGVRIVPGPRVRADLGLLAMTLENKPGSVEYPAGRDVHAGAHAALLLGESGFYTGVDVRVLGRFDNLLQVALVTRYEYPL